MGQYVVEIKDEEILKEVNEQIKCSMDLLVRREMRDKYSGCGNALTEAVREIVYSRKDEIVEKVVDRATKEIVKKGVPKLLERFGENA